MIRTGHLHQRLDRAGLDPLRALRASCAQHLFSLRYCLAGRFFLGPELQEC